MTRRQTNSFFQFSWLLMLAVCSLRVSAQTSTVFDRGLAEFRAGNYSSAAALFAEAESAAPGVTDALLYRAKSLAHLPDFPGAEQALRTYIQSHAGSSDALYMLGFVLNRENRPAESLEAYTKAAAVTTPTSDDLKVVGLDYVLLNDDIDAIKWLEKAVAFDSTNKDAWYYLGRAYYARSQLSDAKRAFTTALQLDPHDTKAENGLGLVFESSAQPADAIDAYTKAITWQEGDVRMSEQPYVNLGGLLLEQGRTKDAIAPLETAVNIASNNAYCRLRLGTAYFRDGQLDKAQRELEHAAELDPENASVHYELGRLYKQMHQLDRAKAEFERTAELQTRAAVPNSPTH